MINRTRKSLWNLFMLFCAVALLRTTAANAQHVTFGATDNATVQGAGPRTGTNGKVFFTLEGSGNDSFASFGVADFDFSVIPPGHLAQAASIVDAQLKLTQDNSFFSTAGPISVYYSPKTGVDIQPSTSPLKDQTGSDGAASVDPLLGPLTLLGSGMFTDTSNGSVDSVPLSFTGDALTSFLNAFNNGSTFRLVVTADAASTAATYVGIGGGTDPFLSVDYTVVPEPNSGMLAAISGALVWRLRKRRQPLRQKKLRFESLEDRRVLATLWVDPYVISIGNPIPGVFATINDAVSAAKNGDTIKVMPGVYQNAVDVDVTKSVTIVGAQVRVTGETTDTSSTIEGNPNSETGFILDANNITIKNFGIENEGVGIVVGTGPLVSGFNILNNRFVHNLSSISLATTLSSSAKTSTISQNQFIAGSGTADAAIYVYQGARNVTISNNHFQGDYAIGAIAISPTTPSVANRATNVQILNNSLAATDKIVVTNATKLQIAVNQFTDVSDLGIQLAGGVTSSQITGNNLAGTGAMSVGIELDQDSYSVADTGNKISGNVLSGLYIGISLDAGNGQNTISNNIVTSSAAYGLNILSDKNTISSNTITRSAADGIRLGGNNNTVSSNTTTSGAIYGIVVFGNNNTISKNTSQGNASSGLFLDDASGTVVSNNNLSGNLDAGLVATGATGSTIWGNVANQNASYGIVLEQASTGNTLVANTTNYNVDDGIFLEQASNSNTLQGNSAYSNQRYGFYIDGSESNHFISNKASLNGENGFELDAAAGNFFTSNGSSGNFAAGFVVGDNSNENLFLKNSVNNNFGEGFAVYGNDNSLTSNTATNNRGSGILVEEVVGVILTGNTVDGNEDGIDISETTNGTISGNTIKDNASDGIFVSNLSENNTFSGNTVTGNGSNSYIVSLDLDDRSTGTGTDGTANTWHHNKAGTANPIGLLTA